MNGVALVRDGVGLDPEQVRTRLIELRDQLTLATDVAPPDWHLVAAQAQNEVAQFPPHLFVGERIDCLLQIGRGFFYAGHTSSAQPVLDEALRLARSGDDLSRLRKALTFAMACAGGAGDASFAMALAVEAYEVALKLGDALATQACIGNLAAMAINADRLSDGIQWADRAIVFGIEAFQDGLLESDVVGRFRVQAELNKSEAMMKRGDYQEAVDLCRASRSRAQAAGLDEALGVYVCFMDYVEFVSLIALGYLPEARALLPRIIEWREKSAASSVQTYVDCAEALWLLRAGDEMGYALLDRAQARAATGPALLIDVLHARLVAETFGMRPASGTALKDLLATVARVRATAIAAGRRAAGAFSVADDGGSGRLLLVRAALSAAVSKDGDGERPFRVAELARRLAAEIGVPTLEAQKLSEAALLHDVGKVLIPSGLLARHRTSTSMREHILRSHADAGAELIAMARVPDGALAIEVARHHHEAWDGTGFPDRLSGRSIPFGARIVAVADRFDGLTHPESGVPGMSSSDALACVMSASGSQFAPKVVEAFERVVAALPPDPEARRAELSASAKTSAVLRSILAVRRVGASGV